MRLADTVVLSESMNVVNCIDAGEENEECCNIEMSLKPGSNIEMSLKPGSDSGDYGTSKVSQPKVVKSCLRNKKDLSGNSGKTQMTSTPTTTTSSNDATEPCLDKNNSTKSLEDKLKNIILSETLSTVPSDLSQGKEECYNVELSLQPSLDEITCSQIITSPSTKTRSKFFKVFGERNGNSKSLSSSSNNKTPSFRNGQRGKMIAVDEVERKIVKKRSDDTVSSGISSSTSFVLNRSNSRIGLGNSRTLSNLSQVHKNAQLAKIRKNPSMTRLDLKKSSSSLDEDIPEPTNATRFNFAITLDSLGGIVCLNPQNREKTTPAVVISYYSKSETGQAVKRNICSLPLTKIFAGKNNDYEDEVVYGAKFNEKFPLNVSLLMGANRKSTSGYTPRPLNLEVSLMKDNEIIKLGKAILTLSGDEYEAERSIPVGTIKFVTRRTGNKKSSSTKVSRVVTSGLEMVQFRSNPRTKYVLHNAFLNICSIQAESSDLNDVYKASIQELINSDTVLSDEFDDEDDVTASGLTFDSCINTVAASAYSSQYFTENGDEIASKDESGADDDNSSVDDSDCQSGTTCTDDASSFKGSMFSGSSGMTGYEASEGHSLATNSGSFSDYE